MRILDAPALGGCQRPQPCPDHQRARAIHSALVARRPLDPYARPGLAQVVELLARVPAAAPSPTPAPAR